MACTYLRSYLKRKKNQIVIIQTFNEFVKINLILGVLGLLCYGNDILAFLWTIAVLQFFSRIRILKALYSLLTLLNGLLTSKPPTLV